MNQNKEINLQNGDRFIRVIIGTLILTRLFKTHHKTLSLITSGELLYSGITGHCPIKKAFENASKMQMSKKENSTQKKVN